MKNQGSMMILAMVFSLVLVTTAWGQMMGSPQEGMMTSPAGGQEYEQPPPIGYYCPYCRANLSHGMAPHGNRMSPGYGMGPGMMGYGMGPGMMGYGRGYGAGPGTRSYQQLPEPLTKDDVKVLIEYQLRFSVRNPNLKLGKIEDRGDAFQVEIVTKDDSLVDQFLVDKATGQMLPVR